MAWQAVNSAIEPLIDAHQAAQILKLHPVTVREMAGRHEIPAMKIGKVWRFRTSALDKWVDEQIESGRHPQSLESEER
jgi:excisionase family DNA binding protein